MSYNRNLISKFNLTGKGGGEDSDVPTDAALTDMMSDPRYLRQSSALINEALQKGFDVLQLANGDIVMTGVKTVVYQYGWDGEKGKLIRTKASSTKKGRKQDSAKDEVEDLLDEEEV